MGETQPDVAVDKVRASRDGHQYHEAWLARRALGLLMPRDQLCGIAVEGLSVEDQQGVSAATIEVADATFYFGVASTFQRAERIEIAQFKYSISRQSVGFRASDAEKTLRKFGKTEADFLSNPQQAAVGDKVRYALYTNRPIAPELIEALTALAQGRRPSKSKVRAQYDQLLATIPLKNKQRTAFAAKLSLIGSGGDLFSIERANASLIADWSASRDAVARARLGDLKQLVRNKAGHAGQQNNLIINIDVLAALEIGQEAELLPTPEAFATPGIIVEREQTLSFVRALPNSPLWVVHAAGGVGKTVFVQSVASHLGVTDEVVLFDCFGGGAYRTPLDVRHRPERGLMHVVNELACRGLCDPILPGAPDPTELVRRSIQRFSQAIDVLRRVRPTTRLVLIIDAADNAAMEARDRGHASFPQMLLESLSHMPPIDGLVCIATARSERLQLAIGRSQCQEFALEVFSLTETRTFIEQRRSEATSAQIEAIHRRSAGNPRVIANLIEPNRSLVGIDAEIADIKLDDLIRQRLEKAIRLADEKGSTRDEISTFLCALSVLPPPAPIEELATAFGIATSEVESFAADLSPLLERTRHGLIFRDEPTETLVRQAYGQQLPLLDNVATRLANAQASSAYAARSLPGLLFAMGKSDLLRALAFDTRFPSQLNSEIAQRAIRLNRIRTAVAAAAKNRDFNAAVDLLVELASLVIADDRGEDYLLQQPDLVVGLGDPEALRRLFEARTGWPGTRHARLATAYGVDGDTAEAYGHAARADDWHRWHRSQDEETRRRGSPDKDDYAAIAFYLVATDRTADAVKYVSSWKPHYGFLIASRVFAHCAAADAFGNLPKFSNTLEKILSDPKVPPSLASAALAIFPNSLAITKVKPLLKKIASRLSKAEFFPEDYGQRHQSDDYRRSLTRCAARMAKLGLLKEAQRTLSVIKIDRYRMWLLRDAWHVDEVVRFAVGLSVRCVIESRQADLFDCLPQDLWALVEDDLRPLTHQAQRDLLDERLKELALPKVEMTKEIEERLKKSTLSSSNRYEASDKISYGVLPLLALVRELTTVISATKKTQTENAALEFLYAWKRSQADKAGGIYISTEWRRFVDALYRQCALQIFAALDFFTPKVAEQLSLCLENCQILPPESAIRLVDQLAARETCHQQAGKAAVLAVSVIEREDDVQRRSQLFADLARALLRANREEAAEVFRRGLKELSSLGSGDYDFTHALLTFTATLRGEALEPATALRLAKICEINVYDSRKWDWPLTGKAFSRASGRSYLAQIARWHDRDKADLSLTLPSALTYLVDSAALTPAIAVSLLWMVDPEPMWHWGWGDLAKALVLKDATTTTLNELLDQFERSQPGRSSTRDVNGLREALEGLPKIHAGISERLASIEKRNTPSRIVETEDRFFPVTSAKETKSIREQERKRQGALRKLLTSVDPIDLTSFEEFVEKLEALSIRPTIDVYRALRKRVAYADRSKHIEAIVAAQNVELSEKIDLLQEIKDEWTKDSPSQLASLSGFGFRIVREHADELLSRQWGFTSDISKLSAVTGTSKEELVAEIVEAATLRELNAAAPTWLTIATLLSKKADPSTPRLALERLLDSGAAKLADESGDGKWRTELDPGTDLDHIVAGLLWFGLGSPTAKERWRAAHAVRSIARLGQWHVVGQMFELFSKPDAGAFQDQSLPFFKLHAHLWFLLSVARIALDFPREIARFRLKLEAIAFDKEFPHAGLREAAREALDHCLGRGKKPEVQRIRAQLAKVNRSLFAVAKTRKQASPTFHWERPADTPEPEPHFYFDYDFEKYEIDSLGRVFGLPKWQVGDLCQEWIRKWAPDVRSMNDYSGRRAPYRDDSYHRATDTAYHSHGTYLTWHALAIVGGKLLQERPVTDMSYSDDPWQEWLSDYRNTRTDGYWLSDATGLSPKVALNDLRRGRGTDDAFDVPIADKLFLAGLAGLTATESSNLIVQASWLSPDNVQCSIMSALVEPASAILAAFAVATGPEFNMWLPFHTHEEESSRFECGPLESWITHTQESNFLDEWDPFGASSAQSIYRPAKSTITKFQLNSVKPWSHDWMQKEGRLAFRYEAWRGASGERDSEKQASGKALYCERSFLSRLLVERDRNLLVLVKLQRYQKRERYGDERGEGKFLHSFMLAIVDKDLNVEIVESTMAHFKAVSMLNEHDRHDLPQRLRVISQSSSRARQRNK